MPKIIKRTVDALVPAERERVVWDDDIRGFGILKSTRANTYSHSYDN